MNINRSKIESVLDSFIFPSLSNIVLDYSHTQKFSREFLMELENTTGGLYYPVTALSGCIGHAICKISGSTSCPPMCNLNHLHKKTRWIYRLYTIFIDKLEENDIPILKNNHFKS